MVTIDLGNIKFNWKGEFSLEIEYKKDDVIRYLNDTYICKLPNIKTPPEIGKDTDEWDLFVRGFDLANFEGKKGKSLLVNSNENGVTWGSPLPSTVNNKGKSLQIDKDGKIAWLRALPEFKDNDFKQKVLKTDTKGDLYWGEDNYSTFERLNHFSNKVYVTGGNSCNITIPASAKTVQFEMWAGGGSGQGYCCQVGGFGGQGGAYGNKVIDVSARGSHVFTANIGQGGSSNTCVCHGLTGCSSCLCDKAGNVNMITAGGNAGWNYCCCQNRNQCYCSKHTKSPIRFCSSSGDRIEQGMGTHVGCAADAAAIASSAATMQLNSYIDEFYCKRNCSNFDLYRDGMHGWSECGCYCLLGCCNWGAGNGGGSYGGGGYSINCCNCGCRGRDANFPGGGSPNRNGGSGMCCAAAGGAGLLILSWE